MCKCGWTDAVCKVGHSLLCRLKVVGAYYSEFKEDVLALADGAAAAGAHPEAAAGDSAQPAAAAPTAAALSAVAIRSRVEAAVAAVMGAVPAATEPLVEAGLDSLGGCQPPLKCISRRGARGRSLSDVYT